jgi:uncharacterized membrane protein YkvA (DUF1232 family)
VLTTREYITSERGLSSLHKEAGVPYNSVTCRARKPEIAEENVRMSDVIQKGRLAWRLINDPRVPGWVKVGIPLLVLLYFFSPIDFIPDILLGLGQLDDLGVVLLGLSLIARFSPQPVVEEHRQAMGMDARPETSRPAGNGPGYQNAPHRGPAGEPTRPIEGEYRVLGSDSQ